MHSFALFSITAFAALTAALPQAFNAIHEDVGTLAPRDISWDGSCGDWSGMTCREGFCCGATGWCGNSIWHCGTGCQNGFGICDNDPLPGGEPTSTSAAAPITSAYPTLPSSSYIPEPSTSSTTAEATTSSAVETTSTSVLETSTSTTAEVATSTTFETTSTTSQESSAVPSTTEVPETSSSTSTTEVSSPEPTTSSTSSVEETTTSSSAAAPEPTTSSSTVAPEPTTSSTSSIEETTTSSSSAAPEPTTTSTTEIFTPEPTTSSTTSVEETTTASSTVAPEPTTEAPTTTSTTSTPAPSTTSTTTTSSAPVETSTNAGTDSYTVYTGTGSLADGWPAMSSWVDFDSMWSANLPILQISCAQFGQADNSEQENNDLRSAILQISSDSGVDARFILAVTMQESKGCVRAPTTVYSHANPGLMQSHTGDGTCNSQAGVVQNPCPASEITLMISDGTEGTAAGDGLVQTLQQANAQGAAMYYRGARIYNSGSIAPSGLLEDGVATHCYASDIANRLTGWVNAATTCNL